MSELLGIGQEQVTIYYDFFRYEIKRFSIEETFNDGGKFFTVYNFNEQGITYQLTERKEKRRHTSVGSYESCTGTKYWIARYTSEYQAIDEPFRGLDYYNRPVWKFPLEGGNGSTFINANIPKGVVDGWLANGTGWYAVFGYPWVGYIENCDNNPNSSFGLSASLLGSFRYPISWWNLEISVGNIKLYDFTDPNDIYNYQDWVQGSGNNYQSSPEEINPLSGQPGFSVLITPSFTESKTYTYFKQNKANGIRLIINRSGQGQTSEFKLEEIDPLSGQVVWNRVIELSNIGTVKNWSLDKKTCPDNTCSVDCGDKICCYGSDGIAVDYYLK